MLFIGRDVGDFNTTLIHRIPDVSKQPRNERCFKDEYRDCRTKYNVVSTLNLGWFLVAKFATQIQRCFNAVFKTG